MPGSISSIKTRIKSINSTKKITGAMKSVSTVKLNRMTKVTTKNNEYQKALSNVADALLSSNIDFDSLYCAKKTGASLYIVFASDVGLCGSYNESLVSYIKNNVNKDSLLYVVGTSIYNNLKTLGYNVINNQLTSDDKNYYMISKIYNYVLNKYFNNEVASIKIIYNKFVNSISYDTVCFDMLPFEVKEVKHDKEILLERDGK